MTTSDDRHFLESAYREHIDFVFRTCLKLAAGNRDWAKDRTQDVFVRLNEKLDGLERENLRPWLRRVAVNECLMDLRRREWRRGLLSRFWSGPTSAASPEEHALAGRDVSALDRALATLPAQQRALLALMYFDGASLTESAELIGVSKGQASKLHKRALEALREQDWEGSS